MAYAEKPETSPSAALPRRLAVFRVSHDLLAHLLRLPEEAAIVATDHETRAVLGESVLTVECDAFPEVPEGAELPVVIPQLSSVDTPQGRVTVFEGWHWP